MTLSFPHKNNRYLRKEFLYDAFFYSVCTFALIQQYCFSKYWGDGCKGRPPTSNFGGTVPPVPPRSLPLYKSLKCIKVSPKSMELQNFSRYVLEDNYGHGGPGGALGFYRFNPVKRMLYFYKSLKL